MIKGEVKIPALNEEEQKIIEKFNCSLDSIPFRFVPLPTVQLQEYLTDFENLELVKPLISKKIKDMEMNISNQKDLDFYLENCFYSAEVPFLTCLEKTIYPGVLK